MHLTEEEWNNLSALEKKNEKHIISSVAGKGEVVIKEKPESCV